MASMDVQIVRRNITIADDANSDTFIPLPRGGIVRGVSVEAALVLSRPVRAVISVGFTDFGLTLGHGWVRGPAGGGPWLDGVRWSGTLPLGMEQTLSLLVNLRNDSGASVGVIAEAYVEVPA